MTSEYESQYSYLKSRRQAERDLDDAEFTVGLSERQLIDGRKFINMASSPMILDSILAADVNLLGGPSHVGKSLLARDWALSVASGQPWGDYAVPEARPVLVVLSEGTHDAAERWATHPLWEQAQDNLIMLIDPFRLNAAPGGAVGGRGAGGPPSGRGRGCAGRSGPHRDISHTALIYVYCY